MPFNLRPIVVVPTPLQRNKLRYKERKQNREKGVKNGTKRIEIIRYNK